MLTVKANSAQHEMIEEFVDHVLVNARRQVLIEATIVEVSLNDQYQAGVDWTLFLQNGETGFTVDQNLLGQITDGVIDNAISSVTAEFISRKTELVIFLRPVVVREPSLNSDLRSYREYLGRNAHRTAGL